MARFRNNKPHAKSNSTSENLPICRMCGKVIRNLNLAISDNLNGEPLHFSCVLDYLSRTEKLGSDESICYIGSGCFGIVKSEKNSLKNSLTIRKRIQYENIEKKSEWRRQIMDSLNL
ncbi:MAG: hypothetical protein DRP87_17580 [Spirochaetes bacterium]|nr:MAG: hypothetical protein DRP87_17580 [Spirochaetota bacterium]